MMFLTLIYKTCPGRFEHRQIFSLSTSRLSPCACSQLLKIRHLYHSDQRLQKQDLSHLLLLWILCL